MINKNEFINGQKIFIKSKRVSSEFKSEYQQNIEIQGVLKENINFNLKSDWKTKDKGFISSAINKFNNVSGAVDLGKSLMERTGVSVSNSGWATKKYYQGSAYINFSVQFDVIDENGLGNIQQTIENLMRLSIPSTIYSKDVEDLPGVNGIINNLNKKDTQSDESYDEGSEDGEEQTLNDSTGEWVKDTAGDVANEIGDIGLNATTSPPSISLQIGDVLFDEMVITSIQMNIKKSLIQSQKENVGIPNNMEVTLDVQSREKVSLDKDGNITTMKFNPPSKDDFGNGDLPYSYVIGDSWKDQPSYVRKRG